MTATVQHTYTPRGAARDILERRESEVLMSGPAGTGKAQPLSATVMTPGGPRRMGELDVGDWVSTPDGDRARIVDVPFRDVAPIYRVTLSDGTAIECSDGHLWDVSWRDSSENQHRAVLPLTELARRGLRRRNGARPKFWLPTTEPVEFEAQDVPVPPYTLGVLLGDGYLRPGEVSFTTADPEMAARVDAEMGARYRLARSSKVGNAAASYRIVADGWRPRRPARAKPGYVSRTSSGKWMARRRTGPATAAYIGSFATRELAEAAVLEAVPDAYTAAELAGDGIHADLDRLGLRNARSATKFIPEVYKLNSAAVRWEVLRGLMDTDGYAERTTVSFTSISRRLAEDVQWLVQSLGGTAQIRTKQPSNGQLAYTVWIRLPRPADAFHLERKRARTGTRQVPVRRWIERVDLVGAELAQCITVDRPDGLYLTEGFAVTHNSRACLEKLHFACLAKGGVRALMVRKTLASMTSSGLVTYQEHVAKESIAAGHVRWFGGSQKEPPAWKYKNGSVLVVGGMDKASKHMSTEYDLIYVQEAIELTKNDWEALTTRLRNGNISYQQLIADTNPDKETHWLNKRSQEGTTVMLESRHEDNPVYYDDAGVITEKGKAYIHGKLDKLTGLRKLRLRYGKWVSAEGVIYEGFDRAVHVIPRFEIPAAWTRYWVVDFGFVHPFAAQWWAEDPDGRLFMYREILKTQRLVEDHARTMLRAVTKLEDGKKDAPDGESANEVLASLRAGYRVWTEPAPRMVICDHDAEDRATLAKHLGRSTTPAKKSVSDGIQATAARLKVQEDGKARLYLLEESLIEKDQALVDAEHPTCLEEEIPGYVWDTADGRKPKDQPLKELDDADDTMRYMVAALDLKGRPGVRWM